MPRQPNVLFLLSDEHGFRHLSARPAADGGEAVRTPTIDALIAHGAWFDRAYCQMPLCTPSRMCFMSGLEQEQCGAWNNSSVLDARFPTIGQTFGAQGYATCLVGKLHFGGSRQKAGFGHRPYGDFGGPCSHQPDPFTAPDSAGRGMRSRTAAAGLSEIPESLLQERMVVDESVAWIREQNARQPDQPWLLNASFSRPHFPLTAPRRHLDRYLGRVAPPRVGRSGDSADHPMTIGMAKGFQVDAIEHDEMMRARAAYFACVDTLDEILGDFLAILDRDGLLENTVVVYASDHGELCGEHGLWWKNSWHEASARVPFIISTPSHRRGDVPASRPAEPVSLGDLFPTLCGLTGVDAPDHLVGTDLSSAVMGGAMPARRHPVLCQNLGPRWGAGTEFRALLDGPYKYVAFRACDDLMFNVVDDPLEQRNLAGTHPDAGRLREAALAGFSFAQAEADRLRDTAIAKAANAALPACRTPNQILLGDGRLVECDTVLYAPEVISTAVDKDYQ